MKVLEKQELKNLQDLQDNYTKLSNDFGQISIKRLILDEEEKTLKNNFIQIKIEEENIKSTLIKKYGKELNINIETGEF